MLYVESDVDQISLLKRDTNARHNVRLDVFEISEPRSYKIRENADIQNAPRSVFQYDLTWAQTSETVTYTLDLISCADINVLK